MPGTLVDLDEVRGAHPIADVVAATGVKLHPRGRGFIGCCPFHDDTTPSLSVDGVPDRFHCFGCGARGDVIQFVQLRYQLSFTDAVALLNADQLQPAAGAIAPPPTVTPAQGASVDPVPVLAVNQAAWLHFTRPVAAAAARAWLRTRRRIDVDPLERHTGAPVVGVAGPSWDRLTRALLAAGFTQAELVAADLARRTRSGGLIDAYRSRVVVPVRDQDHRITGFLGRDTTGVPGVPKYRNPTRTAVYDKSTAVYRPAPLPVDGTTVVVVVEGCLDALAIAAAAAATGDPARFAPCSTSGVSVSAAQARHVAGLHPGTLVLALDGDQAGIQASQRWLTALRDHAGRDAVAVSLPRGTDPADWLATHGPAGLSRFSLPGEPATAAASSNGGEVTAAVVPSPTWSRAERPLGQQPSRHGCPHHMSREAVIHRVGAEGWPSIT